MFSLCLASSRQSKVPSHSHWWGQEKGSVSGKSSLPLLHECGSSMGGMSRGPVQFGGSIDRGMEVGMELTFGEEEEELVLPRGGDWL